VKPLVEARGHTFTVLSDVRSEVAGRRGVSRELPLLELLDTDRAVVWKQLGYASGQEVELRKQVEAALK